MMMSRRVLIALFAILTELVIVAATGNQAMIDYLTRHDKTLWISELRDAFLSFAWRATPRSGQTTLFVGQFAAIAALVVLTFVLVIVVLRGTASFSGAFFTTACVTVTAAVVANMVESVVDYNQTFTGGTSGERISVALVEGSRNPGLSAYSVAMALVTGVAVGFVGASVRRRSIGQLDSGGFAPGQVPGSYDDPDAGRYPGDLAASGFGVSSYRGGGYGSGGYYPPAPTAELPPEHAPDYPADRPTDEPAEPAGDLAGGPADQATQPLPAGATADGEATTPPSAPTGPGAPTAELPNTPGAPDRDRD